MSALNQPLWASSPEQRKLIMKAARGYLRLPFATESVPGAYLESTIAQVHEASVLATYDFVDVVDEGRKVGWQVKSTKSDTPVTWMRAKIPNAPELIEQSLGGNSAALQVLGDAVIKHCNDHVLKSLEKYNLDSIGYSRMIVSKKEIVYFERELVSSNSRQLFDPRKFTWHWNTPKPVSNDGTQSNKVKKEQLSALHGTHVDSNQKWFKWHGKGENQLHFLGDNSWWPDDDDPTAIKTALPAAVDRISFKDFFEWIEAH